MNPPGAQPRLRRAALVCAALLNLLGTIAAPALHGWLHADPHRPGISAERDEITLPAHDELACVICQVALGGALPEAEASPALPGGRPAAPASPLVSLHAAPERSGLQARAPPVSIA